MSKITLNSVADLTQTTTAQTTINANSSTVQTAFDNTLSRDGTSPNQMGAPIDMNSNQILNLPVPSTMNSPARLVDVVSNPTIVVPGTGTSGHVVPFLDGNNTWSGSNTFASLVLPYTPPGTGAVVTTIQAELALQNFYNPKDFGATGNGVTDDTVAFQACITAAIVNNRPVYIPHGQFLISSALNIVSTNQPFSMFGHGLQADCNIVMGSGTQNGLYFNSSSRITLQGFGIRSNVTPTAGSCIFFDGAVNTGNEGFIDNVDLVGFNGITATGLQQFCISNCNIAARGNCISIANPGDSTIYGNRITMLVSTSVGIGITGNAGGLRVSNNKISGAGSACMTVNQSPPGDGDLLIENNSMEGANTGIVITTTSSTVLGNVMIIGNEVGVLGDCLQFPSTSTGWLLNMIISGNDCNTGTAGAGITILAASYFVVTGNIVSGGAGPGSARLTLGAGTIQGLVYGNIVSNAGGIANSGTGNVISNNLLST